MIRGQTVLLVAAARELRDRWLERVNGEGFALPQAGKYDVGRRVDAGNDARARIAQPTGASALLPAPPLAA